MVWASLSIRTTPSQLWPFFRDHPGESMPEENFWTLWCKGRLTEADTPTIQLGATPSGLTSAHLHHPPIFLQAGCPSCRPTNGVYALKATDHDVHRIQNTRLRLERLLLQTIFAHAFLPSIKPRGMTPGVSNS